jgi:hypothetical protein
MCIRGQLYTDKYVRVSGTVCLPKSKVGETRRELVIEGNEKHIVSTDWSFQRSARPLLSAATLLIVWGPFYSVMFVTEVAFDAYLLSTNNHPTWNDLPQDTPSMRGFVEGCRSPVMHRWAAQLYHGPACITWVSRLNSSEGMWPNELIRSWAGM